MNGTQMDDAWMNGKLPIFTSFCLLVKSCHLIRHISCLSFTSFFFASNLRSNSTSCCWSWSCTVIDCNLGPLKDILFTKASCIKCQLTNNVSGLVLVVAANFIILSLMSSCSPSKTLALSLISWLSGASHELELNKI